ncbi:MAG: hypothetical protein U0790_22340 [Isosphaeraceae bacterium]
MRRGIILAAIVMQANITGGVEARGSTFVVVDISGSSKTVVNDINDLGLSVGSFETGPLTHAFIRHLDGSITPFDVAGSSGTYARGIDNNGRVVGHYLAGADFVAYVRELDGSIVSYRIPGSASTYGNGINDIGQITGTYSLVPGLDFHGYVLAPGGILTTFDVPGALWTFSEGISNSGEVVGYYFDGSSFRSYLRHADGSFTTFDIPGDTSTLAAGVNDNGQVVGSSLVSYFSSSGFVSVASGFQRDGGGAFTSIKIPGSTSTYLQGNNDRGAVVGSFDTGGVTRGFILIIPEPCSLSLLVVGILASWIVRRKSCRAPDSHRSA